jgi:hypothetical protein
MPAVKHCPNCQASVSPFATFCSACKTPMGGPTPLARTPRARPEAGASGQNTSVTMEPAERRSLAIGQISLQTGVVGLLMFAYALGALLSEGPQVRFLVYSVISGGFFFTAWAGSRCLPIGRVLLLAYSAFLLIAFPFGTLQAVFQFVHLMKPEARLIFSGRDRFSPDESRDIRIFKEANPNLTAWVRIANFLSLLLLAVMVFVIVLARV